MRPNRFVLAFGSTALLVLQTGCPKYHQACTLDTSYDPVIDPGNFSESTLISNPLMPLDPGTVFTFAGGGEVITVGVTTDTKAILGVDCLVVHDTVRVGGVITEDTYDWYAQDDAGNVWYFGEDTKQYENGVVVGTEGAWEAGVDGAKPGIVMHAVQPAVGVPYRQEYYACEAEDFAEVVDVDTAVSVPHGDYSGCLQTREFTPIEPDVNEYKFYCAGVGLVLEQDVATGTRTELTGVSVP